MRYIIITGAGFKNKGAQAMTLISVAELRKRFPNHRIIVIAPGRKCDFGTNLQDYAFEVIENFPLRFAKANQNLVLHLLCSIRHHKQYQKCREIYRNADLQIDISGYALGSNWEDYIVQSYLDNIEFAELFYVPVVLMPQSFGPFDFADRKCIIRRIKTLLSKVSFIFAREKDGFQLLTDKYGLSNVILKPDMVVSSTCDYKEAIVSYHSKILPKVAPNSVAIIVNDKVFEALGEEHFFALYQHMIAKLLSAHKNIYIICHSSLDTEISRRIKEYYIDNADVHLLTDDYSCIEFCDLIKYFQFCIGSRYHSIVHALKSGVPCIALGWAIKYETLFDDLGIREYAFNVQRGLNINELLRAIDQIDNNRDALSKVILEHLNGILDPSLFDLVASASKTK